ncbi:hypothetical protein MsAc7_15620 [Methanolapillus millepedarum]|uniref:Uncharacterized protein n=1 Tax=Methanolapillus millepedarum TaxID=3028296 RepID=A0AA96V4X1_9EURY|nr:hypothetical protein MsAc7_15620 [Methanosarcinaceae archaeon Ac7]
MNERMKEVNIFKGLFWPVPHKKRKETDKKETDKKEKRFIFDDVSKTTAITRMLPLQNSNRRPIKDSGQFPTGERS